MATRRTSGSSPEILSRAIIDCTSLRMPSTIARWRAMAACRAASARRLASRRRSSVARWRLFDAALDFFDFAEEDGSCTRRRSARSSAADGRRFSDFLSFEGCALAAFTVRKDRFAIKQKRTDARHTDFKLRFIELTFGS